MYIPYNCMDLQYKLDVKPRSRFLIVLACGGKWQKGEAKAKQQYLPLPIKMPPFRAAPQKPPDSGVELIDHKRHPLFAVTPRDSLHFDAVDRTIDPGWLIRK
jgi:hypothetical protein